MTFLRQCAIIATLCCLVIQITATPYDNSKYFQEKYFSPKRTKPSLSIVNPLDVLRQRVMLEMARRQRENAVRQAEANREILKSIGKRGNSFDYNDIEEYLKNRYYDTHRVYQPTHAFNLEGSNGKMELNQHQIQMPQQQGTSQAKPNEKVENKNKVNEPNQEQQVYVGENGDDDDTDVNEEAMQIKNLYGLLSRYSQNEI